MGGATNTVTSPASLRCRICGTEYPVEARSICEECFGPLEPAYDLDAIGVDVVIDTVHHTLWLTEDFADTHQG